MITEKVKNFSIARGEMRFKANELTFDTTGKKSKPMIGLSHGEKINQVHKRQRQFVENIKLIFGLTKKKKFVSEERAEDLDKVIERTRVRNRILLVEIAKFRTSAKLENQPEIEDAKEYTEFLSEKVDKGIDTLVKSNALEMVYSDLMNYVLLENPEFFSRFMRQALIQSTTDTLVGFVTPILADHGFKVSRVEQD